jgi:predicted membrane-bound spermidine synthase
LEAPGQLTATALPSLKTPDLASRSGGSVYYVLFFFSGFPALLYQIVWQRALFTLYGVNIESVTIIVSVFMLGLGLGSLAGGWLSKRSDSRLLLLFGCIELSIGVFGSLSLHLFHRSAGFTAGASTAETGLIAFLLLLIPTLLMGSTLPLLVEHFVRRSGNVGTSVGSLYSVNTFGSATACLCAALFLMRMLGESGSLRLAAGVNALVGLSALALHLQSGNAQRRTPEESAPPPRHEILPFAVGLFLAGAVGFIALAYEIIWYRIYSFASGSAAPTFANLLAFYLFGVAYGSLSVRDICREKLKDNLARTLQVTATVVVLGSIAAYFVAPTVSWLVVLTGSYNSGFVLIFMAAALLGSAFPLLSHASIDPSQNAGKRLSLLYLSNIIGSTLGSFFVGFVVLNRLSTRTTSALLLVLGLLIATAVTALSRQWTKRFFAGALACGIAIACAGPLFSQMYERLLCKSQFRQENRFANLVENRSGVIAVDPSGTVFGGGVYDGHFNIDPLNDVNGIFRAYAIVGMHPATKKVLVIGLSSGSWAQVVANSPAVQQVTIVEINPGYLPLIRERASVSSLLQNPKVHIVIDDGRRWLVGHPNQKFDFILMNTTFNWRANASNLLSVEFMRLLRAHLNAGGIAFYNTTWSKDVLGTGASQFPYALRIAGFLAVSDSPFSLDKERWKDALARYTIDNRPVYRLPNDEQDMNNTLRLADELDLPGSAIGLPNGMLESRAHLLESCRGFRMITDDNMGTEWNSRSTP